jgi:hypothetical protein
LDCFGLAAAAAAELDEGAAETVRLTRELREDDTEESAPSIPRWRHPTVDDECFRRKTEEGE